MFRASAAAIGPTVFDVFIAFALFLFPYKTDILGFTYIS
jgi:hypothetical protein